VLYIAMEYLEGEDLCSRLARVGKLDAVATYRVIAHVARALSSAHALGIVHRDLKPENIFLVPSYDEEIAKVLDFGIAQHEAYRIEDGATREGSFLGTPYYVSPEQARGKPTDHRSDLWSLAVITYQCLTGNPPFDSGSLGELMGLILYEPIPKIRETNPALPQRMEAFWHKATERDRELRFQSAREFSNELGQALGVKTVITVPTLQPRRQSSFPEEGGEHRIPSVSLRPLRTPRQLLDLVPESRALQQPTIAAPEAPVADPLAQTDQAVIRSRSSAHSLVNGLEWGISALKSLPRRPLVIAAVSFGILVGGVGVFLFANQNRAERTNAAPALGDVPGKPSDSAMVAATSASAPLDVPSVPPEVIPVVTEPSAVRDSKPPETLPKKSGGVNPARRRPPVGPDYGI
jgi:serine/threonine-protein kinase